MQRQREIGTHREKMDQQRRIESSREKQVRLEGREISTTRTNRGYQRETETSSKKQVSLQKNESHQREIGIEEIGERKSVRERERQRKKRKIYKR